MGVYVLETLIYLLERIYLMSAIPVRCFDKKGSVLFTKGYKPEQDPVQKLKKPFFEKAKQYSLPFLEFEDSLIIYGIMKDEHERVVVLGPVSSTKLDKENVRRYAINHSIMEDGFFINVKGLVEISATLATLFFVITGKTVSEHDILSDAGNRTEDTNVDDYTYEKYITENSDEEIERLSYNDELNFYKDIREGNVDAVLRGYAPHKDQNHIGKLASKPLKQFEYMICAAIVLVVRVAIDAGLDAMRSYAMGDLFLQRLELCRNEKDMLKVHFDMKLRFTKLIKQTKEMRSKSSYIEKCKVYISNHLNKPFSLDDMADEIGINKSYLSRQFTKEVNIGIKHYTLIKRVDAAANMMRFTDINISEIASYFCFTSQSHFGQIFKQYKGITPQSFREKEKLIDVK
jgi:AraC-like DNA-binding protein